MYDFQYCLTCHFPNAVPVVDSFHVIQWIIRLIDNYIRQFLKKFRQRDNEREEQLSYEEQRPVSLPPSNEIYLLQKYRWLVLANQSSIKYHSDPRMDSHFRCLMNTYDYEDALFRIDPKLKEFSYLRLCSAKQELMFLIYFNPILKDWRSSERQPIKPIGKPSKSLIILF